jgi:hypothetical protein
VRYLEHVIMFQNGQQSINFAIVIMCVISTMTAAMII